MVVTIVFVVLARPLCSNARWCCARIAAVVGDSNFDTRWPKSAPDRKLCTILSALGRLEMYRRLTTLAPVRLRSSSSIHITIASCSADSEFDIDNADSIVLGIFDASALSAQRSVAVFIARHCRSVEPLLLVLIFVLSVRFFGESS